MRHHDKVSSVRSRGAWDDGCPPSGGDRSGSMQKDDRPQCRGFENRCVPRVFAPPLFRHNNCRRAPQFRPSRADIRASSHRVNALASWGCAMFLDDEIASTRTGRNEARWGFYLALAALAVCMVMIFGLVVETSAQAAEPEQQSGAANFAMRVVADPASAAPSGPVGLDRRQMPTQGDRQILAGATLLAAALTAGTTFVVGNQIAAFSRARSRRHGR